MTHRIVRRLCAGGLLISAVAPLDAQTPPIPVRQLPPLTAASTEYFSQMQYVTLRVLRDGRVLVNDARARRLVLLDTNLQNPVVVLDTVPRGAYSYGQPNGTILPFTGDSSLFSFSGSTAAVVIDPDGRVTRELRLPRAVGSSSRFLIADGRHTAFSSLFGVVHSVTPGPRPPDLTAATQTFVTGDTMLVVAMRPGGTGVDTIARVATGEGRTQTVSSAGRGGGITTTITPRNPDAALLSRVYDDWTVMADGSLAIIRGADYHLEFLRANGARASTPPLPFPWRFNSDAEKVRLADSINTRRDRSTLASAHRIAPQDIPDRFPALPWSSLDGPVIIGDADNNVWIKNRGDSPLFDIWDPYDIVSRDGVLMDRIYIPGTKHIGGFGPNGVVYFVSYYTTQSGVLEAGRYRIERASIR